MTDSNSSGGKVESAGSDYAEIIVIRHGETEWNVDGRVQVIIDPDLRERHLGDLQGLVFRAAAKINPEAYQASVSHRNDQEILESELMLSLMAVSSEYFTGNRQDSPHSPSVGKVLNTYISQFVKFHLYEWTIKAWGDVSHLNQTGFLESGLGGDRTSGPALNIGITRTFI